MTPSELRALSGKVLLLNVRGQGKQTIRFRVLGFGVHDVRVASIGGERSTQSTMPIRELAVALHDGHLRIEP